jgi:DNA repair protein RecO (recombination protein O)
VEKTRATLIDRSRLTETSLIVTWCTCDHGIVRTVAKGAMRPKSPFAGKLDLFYAAEIGFIPNRKSDLHTLRDVHVSSHRAGLQRGYAHLASASYFGQIILLVVEPDTPIGPLYELLEKALDYLNGEASPPPRRAILRFEQRVAEYLGIAGDTPAAEAIHEVYHRLPSGREKLMKQLS